MTCTTESYIVIFEDCGINSEEIVFRENLTEDIIQFCKNLNQIRLGLNNMVDKSPDLDHVKSCGHAFAGNVSNEHKVFVRVAVRNKIEVIPTNILSSFSVEGDIEGRDIGRIFRNQTFLNIFSQFKFSFSCEFFGNFESEEKINADE